MHTEERGRGGDGRGGERRGGQGRGGEGRVPAAQDFSKLRPF